MEVLDNLWLFSEKTNILTRNILQSQEYSDKSANSYFLKINAMFYFTIKF